MRSEPSGRPSQQAEGKAKLVICISGLSGTGKSTVGRELAKHYGLRYVSGGEALREKARELGYHPSGPGWWEGPEGMKFMEERLKNPRFDREVDEWLMSLAEEGNMVIDSWTIAQLLKRSGCLKVCLYGSEEVRARRVAGRDGVPPDEALRALREKEEKTRQIYERIYGFDLWDLSPYDLIVDTDNLSPDEVIRAVRAVIESMVARGEFR